MACLRRLRLLDGPKAKIEKTRAHAVILAAICAEIPCAFSVDLLLGFLFRDAALEHVAFPLQSFFMCGFGPTIPFITDRSKERFLAIRIHWREQEPHAVAHPGPDILQAGFVH